MSDDQEFRNGFPVHPPQCDCVACLDAWAEREEWVRALDRLSLLDAQVRQAKPATDREWAEFWDHEFPRGSNAKPTARGQ